MRWPWPPDRASQAVDLDSIDLDELEVVELDAAGRTIGPDPRPAPQPIRETAYATGRDGTGLAGIWEALGAEG